MLKRIISLYLCAALLFSLLPVQVFATEEIPEPTESATEPAEETVAPTEEEPTESAQEETEPTEEVTEPAEAETEATEAVTEPEEEPELVFLEAQGIDSEELLMGYLSPIYTSGEGSFFGTMARDRLSPANRHLYDGVKDRIFQLARGEESNTRINVSFAGSGCSVEDVNITVVQEALRFDYPFETYWYDGCYHGSSGDIYVFVMVPNAYYQVAGFDPNTNPCIDMVKTKKAASAAENIYNVKTRYEAYGDYDKLCAYADEICALVEYDHYAADNNTHTLNINPWTLINVFDNDPTTNVVCEGYSEAFQYLCDESNFQGDIVCLSATGNNHKWNIVRIDGVSYLMDVTHCDSPSTGSVAVRGPKFLGGGEGSVADGYVIGGFHYWYDSEYTLPVYGSGEDSVLKLSPTKYTPPATYTILYDANGGTDAPGSQKKTQGKDLTLRQEIPTWSGHIFQGWATTSTATAAEYQPGDAYSADGDAVLYAVWAEVISGICGENLTWEFEGSTGTLTISGTGAMQNYTGEAPWYGQRENISTVIIENGVAGIGDYAFSGCTGLTYLAIPESVTSIGNHAFDNCTGLGKISFEGNAPEAMQSMSLYNVTVTAYYPVGNLTWTSDVMQNYGGTITWVPYGGVENQVLIPAADLGSQTSVWIDGREYALKTDSGMPYVDLPDGNAKTMVVHSYGVSNGKQYPLGMKVWMLSNENGFYTATRVKELDDVLGYEGCSIRVTGTQGIRMITSLDKADKAALTGAGLGGYTLEEYGTAIAWASQLSSRRPLTLGNSYVSANYAYSREAGTDPVFATTDSRTQYTNVVVGYNLDQCKNDIAMRPYMILSDASGNEITLYGGIVERSIGYIAAQNADTFNEETEADAYKYVWNIIRHVYGEDYIPE